METHKVSVENIMDLEVDDGPSVLLRWGLASGRISSEVLDTLQLKMVIVSICSSAAISVAAPTNFLAQ